MDASSDQPSAHRRRPNLARDEYQLLVTLRGTDPLIWRRLRVLGDVSLETLHGILKIAMGWEDAHLHEFEAGGLVYVMVDPEGDGVGTEVDPTVWSDGRPARYAIDARLDQVAPQRGAHLLYRYDFGDDWEHDIMIEEIEPAERDAQYPACVGGARRCPPEDCGGVAGYEEMLETIRDPSHEEYEETVTWLGEGFDPNEFDIEAVNRKFRAHRLPTIARS